jgi:N-acetylglucosaminyldiphosphoundecaprenol N-acetyl-beta-D-mannosaminyltransferase
MKDTVHILGIEIDSISLKELLKEVFLFEKKSIFSHVNIHGMNIAYHDKKFRDFISKKTRNICDGAGVRLAAKLLGMDILERITYADFMWSLAEAASERNATMYFLGAQSGVADKAKARLENKYPNLSVLGVQHGYFCHEKQSDENMAVVKAINDAQPDILVVGMGMPAQEYWILENFNDLNVNAIFNGGAVFDYVSGELRRAPRWMTDNGFEWLGRLIIEPLRLWRRYIIGNPLFFWRVFIHHILKIPLPYQK